MEEEEKLNFKLEEIFGAGTNCPAMGLAEIHLEPLGLVKKNLKGRGRVLNGKELGQKGGELHEEVEFNNKRKEVPRAGAGCPVRGLTESLLLSLGPALGPLEAGGGGDV